MSRVIQKFGGDNGPQDFAKYMSEAMDADEWHEPRPQIGELEWADKVIAYIEWLRDRSQELKTFTREYP